MGIKKHVVGLLAAPLIFAGCGGRPQGIHLASGNTYQDYRKQKFVAVFRDDNNDGRLDIECKKYSDTSFCTILSNFGGTLDANPYISTHYEIVSRDSEEGERLQSDFDKVKIDYEMSKEAK